MARKYSKKASAKVGRAMKKRKAGTLKSGRSGKKVTSRKQAIAIGLSEARAEGRKVPKKAADTMAEADRVLIPGTVLRSSIRVRKGTSPLAPFVCRRPIR